MKRIRVRAIAFLLSFLLAFTGTGMSGDAKDVSEEKQATEAEVIETEDQSDDEIWLLPEEEMIEALTIIVEEEIDDAMIDDPSESPAQESQESQTESEPEEVNRPAEEHLEQETQESLPETTEPEPEAETEETLEALPEAAETEYKEGQSEGEFETEEEIILEEETDEFFLAEPVTETEEEAYDGVEEQQGLVILDSSSDKSALGTGELSFTDVSETDWFYDAVLDVFQQGLMTGMNETYFGANEPLSRAHFAAILYRRAGYPTYQYQELFPDVKDGEWFTQCVLWTWYSKVILGYDNGRFGPADYLNREQLCTILWRYATEVDGMDNTARASLDNYPDAAKITPFAQEAIEWCEAVGILNDKNGRINAWENASRADCATMISRYMNVLRNSTQPEDPPVDPIDPPVDPIDPPASGYVVENVTYDLVDGEMTVMGYTVATSSYTVQETIDGYPVTRIGDEAFCGNTTLEYITLPDTIEVIGKRAFANCTNLKGMN